MKTKILFIMSSLKIGGAEKQTIDIINGLSRNKFEISLNYLEKADILLEKIDLNSLTSYESCNKMSKFDFNVLFRLKKHIELLKPKKLICVDPYPAFYAHLVRLFWGMKFQIIPILHQTIMPTIYNEIIIKMIYRHIINKSNLVVFVCENQLQYWVKKYRIRKLISHVIHNGIDIDFFNPKHIDSQEQSNLKVQFGIREDVFVIGICAVLRPEKRHTDLLESCKILIDKNKKIKLVIIGDGPERLKIEQKARMLGIEECISITGFQKDVRPFISLCDLMVISSIAVETFSIAILESMAMAKPVIASDIGGASEQIVDGKNGYLYPAGDVNALAKAIDKLLNKSELGVLGDNARNTVTSNFAKDKMILSYEKLLL